MTAKELPNVWLPSGYKNNLFTVFMVGQVTDEQEFRLEASYIANLTSESAAEFAGVDECFAEGYFLGKELDQNDYEMISVKDALEAYIQDWRPPSEAAMYAGWTTTVSDVVELLNDVGIEAKSFEKRRFEAESRKTGLDGKYLVEDELEDEEFAKAYLAAETEAKLSELSRRASVDERDMEDMVMGSDWGQMIDTETARVTMNSEEIRVYSAINEGITAKLTPQP